MALSGMQDHETRGYLSLLYTRVSGMLEAALSMLDEVQTAGAGSGREGQGARCDGRE